MYICQKSVFLSANHKINQKFKSRFMIKKNSFIQLLVVMFLICGGTAFAQKTYNFTSVPNDPLKTRIYTLDNGLKVFMTVYKDAPRIQTAIAVKTGSKYDPHNNTGLSHYLEHMMFKGTGKFGTSDFAKEKPLLNAIDSLFEVYRSIEDSTQRVAIYHIIDSVSGEASKYAIANEYDKLLASIGAKGTNAWTSVEETVYINDIPSNEIEPWLAIESERFTDPEFRLFHTELETVYEEKNMSLDRDDDKVFEALFAGLFLKHTYGTQTTIGTVEHLKNPSLKTLKNYYLERYAPNNMAIILSGDFDPDATIKLIDNSFGKIPSRKVKPFVVPVEDPITAPIVKEVVGPDAESVNFGYRFGGANSKDADYLTIMNMILSNSTAGLIDLNLNQAQKVLGAGCWNYNMKDYSVHVFYGQPKQGQTLEQVKDLLLSQIELVKKGEFPDWLIPAIINDLKLSEIKASERNNSRAFKIVGAFTKDTPWQDEVNSIERLSKITKKDIIDFANKYYNNNYVVVYKRTGTDNNVKKVNKPTITPVSVNRDAESDFLLKIKAMPVKPVEPVFVDYKADIKNFNLKTGIPVLYKKNTENNTFSLYYYFDMGNNNDRKLGIALDYLQYLGTSKLTPAQVQQEFYKAGCSFYVSSSEDQVWVQLNGLSENLEKGLTLLENLLKDAKPNEDALKNMVGDILKKRADDKLSKQSILWNAMYNYGVYGQKSPFTNILSEKELNELKSSELLSIIHGLTSYKHDVLFYGTHDETALTSILNKYHKVPSKLKEIPAATKFEEQATNENKVYVVDYDMKQVEIVMLSKSVGYDKTQVPSVRMFNEYFGGSMNSIVFQEIRESKGLAYSAYAGYRQPSRLDRSNYIFSYIGTQIDKLPEAMKTMMAMINDMPESDKAFDASKQAILQKIRSERITKASVIFNYLASKKLGLDYDIRRDVYQKVPSMTFADMKAFQQKYLKDKNYSILVLGNKKDLDIPTLEKYGKVTFLKLEDIFGY